jgi:hypothetical protein
MAWFTWQVSALAAAGLLGFALLSRSRARWASAADYGQEAAVILGLYALWQLSLDFLVTSVTGAVPHARWVWHVERSLHLPSEVSLQRAALDHPLVIQALNLFYSVVHFPALIVLLIWLFARHREHYSYTRTTLVLVTAACALLQAVPVAPPRLLTDLGFVDAGALYRQSPYAAGGLRDPGQLIAMPSVHVAWAVLIAAIVVQVSRSRWRWLVLGYPALTITAVVATGNHWWLDGIVAVALLALALLVQHAAAALPGGRHGRGARPRDRALIAAGSRATNTQAA